MEYGMDNVTFKQIDLLNVAELGDIFDIECSGVLHHMENPAKVYSPLQKLKPGGYIKLALYSEIARNSSWKHVRQFKC